MSRPLLTQREAAEACGVSRSTIRRRREAGDLPGAVQDPERGWLIPVEALLAAGLRVNAPAPPEDVDVDAPAGAPEPVPREAGDDVAGLRAELERQALLAQVAQARHEAELAAAEARHLRDQLAARDGHIEDLRSALRSLAPPPVRAALSGPQDGQAVVPGQAHGQAADAPAAEPGEPGEARRRWWGGRR
ncbi:helix-turn-helix domain-containing protein [Streptomyces sp. NPDC091278]|uniref:helix-turn-helix transcriptional regulator n=1 Tax=Streptomyces sp. NPDC091278 TaxID=3155301 RepID=UPI00344BA845